MKFIWCDVTYHGARNVTLCTGGPHVEPTLRNDAVHCYRTQHVSATLMHVVFVRYLVTPVPIDQLS